MQVPPVLTLEVAAEVEQMVQSRGIRPCLAAVRVGDDPASAVYVRNKIKACEEAGIRSEHHALPESTSTDELLGLVQSLNARDDVDGILTQLPLPAGIDETAIIEAIDPAKDVDGFHPTNVGLLVQGRARLMPCTPPGIIEMLDHFGVTEANWRDAIAKDEHFAMAETPAYVGRAVAALAR